MKKNLKIWLDRQWNHGLIDDRDKTLCAVTLINATGEEAKVLSELTTKKFHLNDFIIGLHLHAPKYEFCT